MQQLEEAATTEEMAWDVHAEALAAWTLTRMANREDAYGLYYVDGSGKPRTFTENERVDSNVIRRHFAEHRIIGLHSTSKNDVCRWLIVDIDRHDGDPDDLADKNGAFARELFNDLRARGFHPLLLDSNGRGGYHLIVLFDEPVHARDVRAFGLWIVRKWKDCGLTRPEVFPKQNTIRKPDGTVGYGNYVRLFGRHYKRPFFSKAWDGEAWLEGEAAIEHILGLGGDSFERVPAEALTDQPPPEARTKARGWWEDYPCDLKALDIAGLFASRGLRAEEEGDGQFEVRCPWAVEHTMGDDSAGIAPADRGAGLFPAFHCFHDHCTGRTIQDVLEFFGREAVERHCRPTKIREGEGREPLIDSSNPLTTARLFRQSRGGALVHHGGDWRRWDEKRYGTVAEGDVKAEIWRWLETTSQETKGVRTPFRPTRAAVANVLEALKAAANLPSTTAMPSWLGEGDDPRPEDVVAFDNGLLDLEEFTAKGGAKLRPHSTRWYSDNCLPHPYDAEARCPRWLEFLDGVFEGDAERIRAMAQWYGYCLTSDISQHRFTLLLGPPRSGKGTALRVLTAMLGASNVVTPTFKSMGDQFGLAPFLGKLAAIIGDAHLGRQSDAVAILERLKSITGGDPQNVNRKNAPELVNVLIRTRFSIAANELPRFPDASAALRSRMLVIPFHLSFEGREDTNLGERLLAEIPGITNWALEGLLDLRRTGRFVQPAAGSAILDDFTRLSSSVRSFVNDRCEVGSGFWIECDLLRAAWLDWCVVNGNQSGSVANLGAKLRAVDPRIERTRRRDRGKQTYGYAWLRLAESS